ncbi:MAG: 2-oxoglutarate dehydrogenase, E2 component, dihydrolipoamide succinyltransferase [Candidatus Krumholzibacteriia bacterium]
MSTDVIMPQMGESIAEGTVTKWLKKVGDHIERDEALFEISTDKVDAEIPAPAEGVLLEILVPEGETVEINTIVARIGGEGEVAAAPAKPAVQPAAPQPTAPAAPEPKPAPPAASPQRVAASNATTTPQAVVPSGGVVVQLDDPLSDRRKTRSSPLVRKIAAEHGVDISLIDGSGVGGRVTKKDIVQYIESAGTPDVPAAAAPAAPASAPPPAVAFPPGERVVREKMTVMRRKIAEHMIMSRRTSAHVQTWQECDMQGVVEKRAALKGEFERAGVKLTFTAFIAEAVVKALQAFPMVNASIEGDDTILYHQDVNLGIAVALDWGLIVPVVKNAGQMNLMGLARSINDLAERARTKRLSPDDVQSGTFTITNPGVFGSLMGAPIINQPQVAILGVGVIKKRPVVIDDAIAIRPVMYLSLSFDHRLVDGAEAAKFLSAVVAQLENPS